MGFLVLIYIAYCALFGVTSSVIARSRDRDPAGWFMLGLLFGVFALIALIALPPAGRQCPACSERVRLAARRCRYCGETLPEIDLGAASGSGVRNDSLVGAARSGDVDLVKRLLVEGADPNGTDRIGWTALFHAVNTGRTATAKTLLEAGADPDVPTAGGVTSRQVAQQKGFTEIEKLIAESDERRPTTV